MKVTIFLPSFRFNDAICSEVGVNSLTFFFVRLGLVSFLFASVQILFSGELPKISLLASFGIGGEESLDPVLLKEKGQILQLPPGGELLVDVPPA